MDELRHERGEPVVVAEADLVGGHGVVLVDDGQDAEGQQLVQRAVGVAVMRASGHVVGGQEHLSHPQAVHGERVGVPGNEQPLPDARGGLLGGKVAGPVGQTERRARPRSLPRRPARPRGRPHAAPRARRPVPRVAPSRPPAVVVSEDEPTFTTIRCALATASRTTPPTSSRGASSSTPVEARIGAPSAVEQLGTGLDRRLPVEHDPVVAADDDLGPGRGACLEQPLLDAEAGQPVAQVAASSLLKSV